MHKIGVIGDKDSILGFKALGISSWEVEKGTEVESALQKLVEEGYALIFITEELAAQCASVMERYGSLRIPALIPIPGRQGSLGIGKMGLRKAVERAVGADILFRDG